MAWTDDSHVITCDGIVIWEALTNPDISDKDGSKSWNLRIAVDPASPEVAELKQLHQKALRESKKPNVNVQRPGNDPISTIDAAKFPEIPPHWVCFSAGSKQGAPIVMSIDGAEMQPMAYGPLMYNGTKVRMLVHAYAYDNVQKGVNFGLDGVQIIDGQAPRLSIGAAGMSKDAVKAAFGAVGGGQQQQQTPPPVQQQAAAAHQPPPPPHTGYMGTDAPPPPPPAAVAFPPAGWWPHPQAPGSFYNAQNEVLTEAALRARVGA
jgi:hypothetical protein